MDWKYMPDTMHHMRVANQAKAVFKNFWLAGMRSSEDGIEVYDWRNRNCSSKYHIRFVVDVYNGALYVTGDLGQGVFQVGGDFTFKDWAGVTMDYFEEKLKCCSEAPRFNENLFREDFIREARERGFNLDEDDGNDERMLEVLTEFFCDNIEGCLPEPLRESFEQVTGIDDYEWMQRCGRRFPGRVIYWKMALETIKELL